VIDIDEGGRPIIRLDAPVGVKAFQKQWDDTVTLSSCLLRRAQRSPLIQVYRTIVVVVRPLTLYLILCQFQQVNISLCPVILAKSFTKCRHLLDKGIEWEEFNVHSGNRTSESSTQNMGCSSINTSSEADQPWIRKRAITLPAGGWRPYQPPIRRRAASLSVSDCTLYFTVKQTWEGTHQWQLLKDTLRRLLYALEWPG
jgi:hypothetical protein